MPWGGLSAAEGAMKTTSWTCLLLLVLASLAPAGLRSAGWLLNRPKAVALDMAVAGEELFRHKWTAGDPLAAGGDGLGPAFNNTSCVGCHFQNRIGGSGSLMDNVTTFI